MRFKNIIKISLMISIILIILIQFNMYKSNVNSKQVLLVGKIVSLNNNFLNESNNYSNKIQTSNNEIGIMSFIDLDNNSFFALGHPFRYSIDANEITGEVYEAKLKSIEKSTEDSIGRLYARADTTKLIGNMNLESYKGIYGEIDDEYLKINKNDFYVTNIASKYDITKGKCSIFIDFDGNKPLFYEAEIEDINYFNQSQNLTIKIIDNNLIYRTGGSVRGMSGSPIIQNGKLVGILNYAENNDSCKVLAIFAEDLIK